METRSGYRNYCVNNKVVKSEKKADKMQINDFSLYQYLGEVVNIVFKLSNPTYHCTFHHFKVL